MPRILVTGSIAYDILLGFEGSFLDTIRPESLDHLSVFHFSPHYTRQFGGTGANIAWGIATLGLSPLLVGTVGHDGQEYLNLLAEHGVSTQYVEKREQEVTATAIIGTDDGERQIGFFHPGADAKGTWPDLTAERSEIAYAISSPRDPLAMMACLTWCHEQGVPVIFDPGQQVHMFGNDELQRLVHLSAMVIVNAYEWKILQEKLGCNEKTIIDQVPIAIITKGEEGLTYIDSEGPHHVKACLPRQVVNPTGAGDALRAGLLSGLTSGWSLQSACQLGCAMGSFAVEIDGTLIHVEHPSQIFERAQETYQEKLPVLARA